MLENEIDKMLNNSDSADSHNHKRKSLGRGLGALLGEDDLDLDNVEDLSSLAPAPATARKLCSLWLNQSKKKVYCSRCWFAETE